MTNGVKISNYNCVYSLITFFILNNYIACPHLFVTSSNITGSMCICVHVYVYVYICVYMCTRVCACMDVCVCIYIYICMYMAVFRLFTDRLTL